MNESARRLHREFRVYARYLIGVRPPWELAARYTEANRVLFADEPAPSPLVQFVHLRPWSLPYIDAACGLLKPDDMLRRKLLLAAAILETTPEYAGKFLPRMIPLPLFLLRSAWIVLRAGWQIAGGIALWPWAKNISVPRESERAHG